MEAGIPVTGATTGERKRTIRPSKRLELDRKVMEESPKEIQYLPIHEIGIHYNTLVINGHRGYQRQLNVRKIETMVDTFNPEEITAIVVHQRSDGSYWVIDGQHRLEALKQLGKQVILADVRSGLTFAEEARLFYRLNAGTTRVPTWDQFQARVASEDPVAVGITNTIERYGYHLDKSGVSTKGIAAVRAVEKVYRRGYLDEVLDIISRVWRSEGRALDGPVIEGLAIFLHSYREQDAFNMERFLDILSVTPAVEVLQRKARLVVEMGRGQGQPSVMVAMALRDIYNGKRRTARKLSGPPISGAGKSLGYVGRRGAVTVLKESTE